MRKKKKNSKAGEDKELKLIKDTINVIREIKRSVKIDVV